MDRSARRTVPLAMDRSARRTVPLAPLANHLFSDGGILNNIPVIPIKEMGADKVLAINFDSNVVDHSSNIMDIMMKTVDIMGNKISEKNLQASDCILTIPAEGTGLLDINKIDCCYSFGYNTTINNINRIKEAIHGDVHFGA